MDDQFVADHLQRDFVVGLIAARLEEFDPAVSLELGEQRAIVIDIRPVRIGRIGFRGRGILGDEDAFGDAPICRVGRAPAALATSRARRLP
jgi:hypothetical protein